MSKQVAKEKRSIPLVVEALVHFVEDRGMNVVGIYRLSGNIGSIQKLRLLCEEDIRKVNFHEDQFSDVNTIAGTLKLYLRELRNPAICFDFYDSFIEATSIFLLIIIELTDKKRTEELKRLAKNLPKPNYDLLKFLLKHLKKIAANSEVNKMDASNLSIVFGPTLMRPMEETIGSVSSYMKQNTLIETMIEKVDDIFSK